jgi:hypothetical protein
MAITQNTFTGDGSTVLFSFTFPYLDESHIKVSLNGSDTILYTLANATTIQMNTAPANGAAIRVYRNTDSSSLAAQFFSGSSIRAQDLNDNFTQVLFKTQETENFAASTDSSVIAGTAASAVSTANTALSVANTANTTANGIAATANTALSNSTAAVTTANAANALAAAAVPSGVGAIVNADINASAGIVDTKLATIATAGKVSNSATTATDANTASAIVARSAAGNFNITSINNGPLAGMRNAIINGNFDHWQRGTSQTVNGYGSADRWRMYAEGGTVTASRQSFVLGQTDVPGEPTYFYRTVTVFAAGAGNQRHLTQHIEDVRTYAGQQVTVSFWAKADAAKNISIELEQLFGTGGSPSANISAIGVVKVALTTSWQKITRTVSIPSISGKTLGTDGNSYLQLNIWFDAGSDFNARTDSLGQQSGTFEIAQVQLEPGPVDTPFERRPIGTELGLCQRYFQQTPAFAGVTANGNELSVSGSAPFYVPMRANPTATIPVGCTFHRPGVAFYAVSAVLSVQDASGGGYMNVTIAAGASTNTSGQIIQGLLLSAEL